MPKLNALITRNWVDFFDNAAANRVLSSSQIAVIVNVVRRHPGIVSQIRTVSAKLDQVIFRAPVNNIPIVNVLPAVAVALAYAVYFI